MALPNSTYSATKIYPHLTEQAKKRRLHWAKGFWLFWYSATLFSETVQIVLVHMDEKWFYAIVVRKNNKCIPFLGIDPHSVSVHTRTHIDKCMAIASTAFVPHDNDITKGGTAEKLSLTRVGYMKKAAKDSYRRVYHDDGTFTYPKIPENKLRTKGEPYFEPLEICGSTSTNGKKKKFSLLDWFLKTEFPRLEALAARLHAQFGKKIVIRYQIDGAGPHTDGTLLAELQKTFDARSWILKFQPANSPLTNVKDACVFPCLSKAVTAEQGLSFGSCVLRQEQLWAIMQKVWEDLPLETIARAYAGHHQIVNGIARCNGGDEFAKEKGGLHFGVRKHCVPFFANEQATTPSGVTMVSCYDNIHGDLACAGLKYENTDVSSLAFSDYLNQQEKDLLVQHLPPETGGWVELAASELEEEWLEEEEEKGEAG
jgi:hypothetical protein